MKSLRDFKNKNSEDSINESMDVVDTADYKISATGKKYKAHRIKIGDTVAKDEKEKEEVQEEIQLDESSSQPPFVLLLKRVAIRSYPNNTKVAIYYNDKLKKEFAIPFMDGKSGMIQAEEVQNIEESVMDQLHKIVAGKQGQSVKFGNGQTRKVDHFTASAITQVHKAVNDENKKKLADMVHKSPAHFEKVASFAFSKAK